MKLIIARPSPYARKVRIALLEKGIAFETLIENPWLPNSTIAASNPLAKVPALILTDGTVVHDSSVIIEYLETLVAAPALIPRDPLLRVAHRQVEATADGICDAVVLMTLENARPAQQQSADWIERQRKKVVAGIAELSRLLADRDWFTEAGLGLAEIATVCALDYIDLRYPAYAWRADAANLRRLRDRLSARPSFAETRPAVQALPSIG